MSLASRSKVLSVFKTLQRTREKVFDGDDHALKCKEEYEEVNMYGKRIKVCIGLHHGEKLLFEDSSIRNSKESFGSTDRKRTKYRNHVTSVPIEKFIIREKIKEEFRKHAKVADPVEIQNLIKIANESNDILLKKVVQAREIRPNVYSIRKEDLQTKCVGARETCADCTCGRADIKI